MPESLAVLAVEVGGWFAADAALGGVAALTAEEAAGMGIVGAGAGELSSAEAAALVAGGAGGAEAVGGAGLGAATAADVATGATGMGIADATGGLVTGGEIGGAGLGGGATGVAVEPGITAGAGTGATTGGAVPSSSSLESLFGPKGTLSTLFAKGGAASNIMQLASGGYGLLNAMQLGRMATRPNKLGQQAVMRSMASQGYQGSGNMMAALSQYGINGSQAAAQAGMGPLVGAMSSLGLISGGLTGMFGGGTQGAGG